MRMLRTILSTEMLRLFITDCSACAFLLAPVSERSAPTATTITTEKSAMDTIISIRVKPELEYFVFSILYLVSKNSGLYQIRDTIYHIPCLILRFFDGNLPVVVDDDAHRVAARRLKGYRRCTRAPIRKYT